MLYLESKEIDSFDANAFKNTTIESNKMISLDDLLQRKKKSVFNNLNLSSINNVTPSRLFHSDETNKVNNNKDNKDEEVSLNKTKIFNSNTNISGEIDEELRDTVEELRDSVYPLNNTSNNNNKNRNTLSSSNANNNVNANNNNNNMRNAGKRNPMDEE